MLMTKQIVAGTLLAMAKYDVKDAWNSVLPCGLDNNDIGDEAFVSLMFDTLTSRNLYIQYWKGNYEIDQYN